MAPLNNKDDTFNSRSKRRKKDIRSNALDKIRKSRKTGEKINYEEEEEEGIYEYVDEETYAKRIAIDNDRSWIEYDANDPVLPSPDTKSNLNPTTNKLTQNVAPLNNYLARKTAKPTNQNFDTSLDDLENDSTLNDILKDLSNFMEVTPTKKPFKASCQDNTYSNISKDNITLNKKYITSDMKDNKSLLNSELTDGVGLSKTNELSTIILSDINDEFNQNVKTDRINTNQHSKSPSACADISQNRIFAGIVDSDTKFSVENNSVGLEKQFSFEFSDLSNDIADIEISRQSFDFSFINTTSFNQSFSTQVEDQSVFLDNLKEIQLYWLDCAQSKTIQNSVFLFGKVYIKKKLYSCMCHVKNMPNQFWLQKRKEVRLTDIYSEIKEILKKAGIFEFKCRVEKRRYPFSNEEDLILDNAEFLNVLCLDSYKLGDELTGKTFSRVIGLKKSLCEYFILTHKLKGPCWLTISFFSKVQTKISYCNVEMEIKSPEYIKIVQDQPSAPPLSVLSINMFTSGNENSQHITCMALVSHNDVSISNRSLIKKNNVSGCHVIICPPPNGRAIPVNFSEYCKKKNFCVDITSSSKSLLTLFFHKLNKIDPDIIIGLDLFEYTFKTILHCCVQHGINIWSMLGRLKQNSVPKSIKHHEYVTAYTGRIVINLKSLTRELIKLQSYSMSELCLQLLNITRQDIDTSDLNRYFANADSLFSFLQFLLCDAFYYLSIMNEIDILPLFHQISSICGQPMGRSLTLGRAERVEYLLLHGYIDADCICPDKIKKDRKNGAYSINIDEDKTKQSYVGGLVLEPKTGYYSNYVLLFDYMSLYPSLIQEFNICFTTMKFINSGENEDSAIPLNISDQIQGVIPKEIKKLVERRRQVKQLLKSAKFGSSEYSQLDIRQKALKLIANSIYGCLGYQNSRFFAKPLAALVTTKGREILSRTKEIVSEIGYEVIYGDTDSIMINTKAVEFSKLTEISNHVISVINKNYNHLKIELDGIFKPLLLLKKKKYAAISLTQTSDGKFSKKPEIKGLDIIRHDWSIIAKETGQNILNLILDSDNHDSLIEKVQDYLTSVSIRLNSNKIDLEKLIIRKNLTKNLNEYPDNHNLPHVNVARRLYYSGHKFTIGDTIEYIVCLDGTSNAHTQRSYHISEVRNLKYLPDTKYYLETQLQPCISRLCEPIDGLDSSFICKCLQIESRVSASFPISDLAVNDDIERLQINCSNCGFSIDIESLIRNSSKEMEKCKKCKKLLNFDKFFNDVLLLIHRSIREYYSNTFTCTNNGCSYSGSFTVSLHSLYNKFKCPCNKGRIQLAYPSSRLYEQITYVQNIFDSEKGLSKLFVQKEYNSFLPSFKYISQHLSYIIEHFGYANVDLSELFIK